MCIGFVGREVQVMLLVLVLELMLMLVRPVLVRLQVLALDMTFPTIRHV